MQSQETSRTSGASRGDIAWPMAFAAIIAAALYALLLRKFTLFGPASSSLSQLPVIMHFVDPQILAADWYTQSMSGFSARYFYFRGMSGLAGFLGLAPAYVAVQIAALIAVGSVTLFAAVEAFRLSRVAGAIAGMLAIAISSFTLGSNVEIVNNTLIPKSIATPFGLLAIVLALRGKYLACAVAGALGSLMQPVYGLFPGALALISVAIVRPWRFEGGGTARAPLARLVLALCLIALVAAWWSSLASVDVAAAEAVRIVAEIRNPHHFRFSAQPASAWALAACLLVAGTGMVIVWRRIEPRHAERELALRHMLVICSLIGVMWIIGFVAIELRPSKLGLALQPMRYLFIPLWICIIATAAVATGLLETSSRAARWGWSLCLLGGNAWIQPVLLLIGSVAALRVTRESSDAGARVAAGRGLLVIALIVQLAAFIGAGKTAVLACGVITAALAVWLTGQPLRDAGRAAQLRGPILGLAVVAAIVWGLPSLSPDRFAALAAFRPTEDRVARRAATRDLGFAAIIDISREAREVAPIDAIFLTPPDFGPFRIVARRAIVVDFKAWPFRTPGAWFERLTDCYGPINGAAGFELVKRFSQRYRAIDDARIRGIAERYGATHAVLYRDTPSHFPTLAETGSYKIVSLASSL